MRTFNCDGCGVRLPSEADGIVSLRVTAKDIAINLRLDCECPLSGERLLFCMECTREVLHVASSLHLRWSDSYKIVREAFASAREEMSRQ